MTEAQPDSENLSLNDLPIGKKALVKAISGDRETTRKLLSLGVRRGSVITVLQHRGRGVVVASNGTRVALGESIASRLTLQLID